MSKIPELVRLERQDTAMNLTYAEGSKFSVTYDDIRYFCPCAKCAPLRNEDETAKALRREGCSSGIYRFERLWALANNEDPDGGKPYVHGAW